MRIAQCGFHIGQSTIDQVFALQRIFGKLWECAKEVNACFVDLDKTYDHIPSDKLQHISYSILELQCCYSITLMASY